MNHQVAETKSFDERMVDMFRANIGNLMTEEEMKKIAERSLEQVFFKERKNPSSHYNAQPLPPLALEVLAPEIKKLFEQVMEKWIQENADAIMEQFKKHMGSTPEEFALKAIASLFSTTFFSMESNIHNRVYNMVNNQR